MDTEDLIRWPPRMAGDRAKLDIERKAGGRRVFEPGQKGLVHDEPWDF
jgi:hypothetical protein